MTREQAREQKRQAKRDRDAEAARVSITVGRDEWDALHAMRERTEVALTTYEALQRNYASLLVTNSEQLARLTKLTMEVDHVKVCLRRSEEREGLVSARAKQLEADLAAAKLAAANAEVEAAKKYEHLLTSRGVAP